MNKEMVELAMLFKSRDNKQQASFVIGKVVNVFPLKIGDGDEILLEGSQLITLSHLLKVETFKKEDKVVLIPSNDGNTYLLLGKAVTA